MKGDYGNGRIYKISPLNGENSDDYYGSTCQPLTKRFSKHKAVYKLWKNGSKKFCSSFLLFDKYGIENCKIYLVEAYPCNSKEELFAREGDYIKNNKCINKNVAGRTAKEYYVDNKDSLLLEKKEYYKNNKQIILDNVKQYTDRNKKTISERRKKYYNANQSKFNAQRKMYYEENKEKLLEYTKSYYENNKEKILAHRNTKVHCECGGRYSFNNRTKHEKTFKHKRYIDDMI